MKYEIIYLLTFPIKNIYYVFKTKKVLVIFNTGVYGNLRNFKKQGRD